MLFAAIDIGSNAGRLLFGNVFEHDNRIHVEKSTLIRIPLRLGEDTFSLGKISNERVENLLNTMKAFKYLIQVYKPVDFKACATAAIREASNGKEVVKLVKEHVGLNIEIVDGVKEAELICASHHIDEGAVFANYMYIDVGGGSTEISIISDKTLVESYSFKIGTIRMLNGELKNSEWDELERWLRIINKKYNYIIAVGSGGNINKLSKLYGKKDAKQLSLKAISHGLKHLESYSLDERIEYMGLRPDRADVIIPAAKIFITILKIMKLDKIMIPRIGLTDGLIHKIYQEYKAKNFILAEN